MKYENKATYKLFEDEPELTLVEVEEDDDVFTVGEFLQECIEGCFMDYDGWGYFVQTIGDKYYAFKDIGFSIDKDEVYYKEDIIPGIFYFCNICNIKKIVWFNR